MVGRQRASEGALEGVSEYQGIAHHALLVQVDFSMRSLPVHVLSELHQLALSAGLVVVGHMVVTRNEPVSKTYIGSGKLEELVALVRATGAGLVIINQDISPAQERNIEQMVQCRVIDRTSLILDVFAQRARTHAGKLQVELAQLERLSTRLVRGWTHLERQKGGIGLRGPGEKQLETDRRLIGQRIKLLKARLAKVEKNQQVQRGWRSQSGVLKVALVGYTNAGKSSLFNRLTHATTFTADQLFATLDSLTRRIFLSTGRTVVLTDTVGFIRHLPHSLVSAFRGTLEESQHADLLLIVLDAHDDERWIHLETVQTVLRELGAHEVPRVLVMNKADLLEGEMISDLIRDEYGRIEKVYVSATTGEGIDRLRIIFNETFEHSVSPTKIAHSEIESL